ncbi:MAG: large subunit ribosomal protein [Chloroflexota bacterium]|jgi:large subunit ribosomal protein L29|nr:large subunit ribosomal protein [Chloroflexota bacterium]
MKVDELRILEVDELGGKLKAARRELYELRFKHAVGQLENSSQISKVRHDIARIMTVLQERAFGIVAQVAPEAITVTAAAPKTKKVAAKAADTSAKAEDPHAGHDHGPKSSAAPKRAAKATKTKSEKAS